MIADLDKDGSGAIDYEEFEYIIIIIGLSLKRTSMQHVVRWIPVSGTKDYWENS